MRNFCIDCNREVEHEIMSSEDHSFPREIFSKNEDGLHEKSAWVIVVSRYELVRCSVCKMPSFVISEVVAGSEEKKISSYPRKHLVGVPSWLKDCPVEYYSLLSEISGAINHDSFALALMGLRTIIDMMLVGMVGDIGSFEKKVEKAESDKRISTDDAEMMRILVNAGGAAAHRGYKPSEKVILELYETMSHFMNGKIRKMRSEKIRGEIPKKIKGVTVTWD